MSSNFDWNALPTLDKKVEIPPEETQGSAGVEQSSDYWNQFQTLPVEKEGVVKKTGRYLAQPGIGALEFTTPGIAMNMWQLMGTGEALDELQKFQEESREEELRQKFPTAPWPEKKVFDREKYLEALEGASKTVPTVSNIASFIEKQTGLPLEAQTKWQRRLRLAGGGAKIKTGGIAEKLTAGVVTSASTTALQAAGVPEPIADIISLGIGQATPTPKISKVTKESGMPTRWYEGLKKETKLTPNQYTKVKEAVEGDVKSLTNKLIKSESKTARAIEEFPDFNEKIDGLFGRVSELSESIEDKVPTYSLRNTYRRKINTRETKGISPDEFERAYLKESRKLYKTIPDSKEASVKDLLDQYRKNNKSFSELYEPGKSGALNRAKREALLDYNRAISDTFEKRFPDSEFNSLFKFTNKRYMERMDLESIDVFFDKIFGEKINYKQARKFFDNQKVKNSFKRTLGDEGYKDMQGIMKDFMSTEQSMKLIKRAESAGFKDIVKYAKKWALSPLWAKGAAIKDLTINARNELLSSKKFRITWKNALDDFKTGNFAKAEEEFKQLDTMEKGIKNP